MPTWLRRAVLALSWMLLASWAWSPALLAELARDEFPTLLGVADLAQRGASGLGRGLFTSSGTDGHALATLELLRSRALWSDGGSWHAVSPWPLRAENAVWLVLAAWLWARFVRRLLAPWTGADQARAASWAAAALFSLHPVQPAVICSVAARGDLLALCLSAAAAWLFLRGRQKQDGRSLAAALACAVLAGLSSDRALALAPLLALAELVSAKRQRVFQARLRTAGTTLLVFGAAVLFDTLLRSVVLETWSPPVAFAAWTAPSSAGELAQRAAITFERLGTLLVPVDLLVLGALGLALAGALLLIALQPALSAARTAPRLWGWILLAWTVALAASEAFAPNARVRPEDFTHAASLAPTALVACAGLAVCATAFSGARRVLLPSVLVIGFAILGRAHAGAFRNAASEGEHLRADLARACDELEARTLFVLDPPALVDGIDVLDHALPSMLDALFCGGTRAGRTPEVRCASTPAFLAFARERELELLREDGVALVLPEVVRDGPGRQARDALSLPKARESSGPRVWLREGLSPSLDLDPLTAGALHVRATEEAAVERRPAVAWRSAGSPLERFAQGELAGTWLYGGDAPEALFDLSSSLDWLCAGRVEQVWSAEGWSRFTQAELLEGVPRPERPLEPRAAGDDWIFAGGTKAPLVPSERDGAWTVCLLVVERLEYVELAAALEAGGTLRVPGANARARQLAGDDGTIAWSLERRLEGVAVERARGRRVP